MTEPYDPSLPPPSSELAGPPGTGPSLNPAGYDPGSAAGALGGPLDREPVGHPAGPAAGFDRRGRVRATKVSGVWIGSILTALFVILLIIFIAQNSGRATIHFFGWHGKFSLALTILLAAVLGVLLVAIPGSLRIMQLRRALRKNAPHGRVN